MNKLHEIEIGKVDIKTVWGISIATIDKHIKSDPNFPKLTTNKKFNLLELIQYFKNANTQKANTTTDAKLKLLELQSRKLELTIREQENELVEIEHVKDQIQKMTQKIKQLMENLPRKIAKKVENKTEMEVEIISKDVIAIEIEKLIKEITVVQG